MSELFADQTYILIFLCIIHCAIIFPYIWSFFRHSLAPERLYYFVPFHTQFLFFYFHLNFFFSNSSCYFIFFYFILSIFFFYYSRFFSSYSVLKRLYFTFLHYICSLYFIFHPHFYRFFLCSRFLLLQLSFFLHSSALTRLYYFVSFHIQILFLSYIFFRVLIFLHVYLYFLLVSSFNLLKSSMSSVRFRFLLSKYRLFSFPIGIFSPSLAADWLALVLSALSVIAYHPPPIPPLLCSSLLVSSFPRLYLSPPLT